MVPRLATINDADGINSIYNHYVLHSTCTYQEQTDTRADRIRWLTDRDPTIHPVIVLESEGEIVGFGALSAFHRRSAYRFTAENTVYVRNGMHCRRIGSVLLSDLIVRAQKAGLRSIVALIDAEQLSSISLHRRHGFVRTGTLQSVGFKFSRWLDVEYWQLTLPD